MLGKQAVVVIEKADEVVVAFAFVAAMRKLYLPSLMFQRSS